MRQDTSDTPRFDEYLNKIESLEKARRRKRFLMALPVLILAGAGIWFLNSSPQDQLADTDIVQVNNTQQAGIAKADNSEFLNIEPTIHTVRQEQPAEELSEETAPVEEAKEAIWFSMDVSGRRQVRERLVYRIENFRNDFTYSIDFGNGVIKPMTESITYRYPLPGHFDMTLTAVSPDGEVVEYVKKYEILPAVNTATAQVSQP